MFLLLFADLPPLATCEQCSDRGLMSPVSDCGSMTAGNNVNIIIAITHENYHNVCTMIISPRTGVSRGPVLGSFRALDKNSA